MTGRAERTIGFPRPGVAHAELAQRTLGWVMVDARRIFAEKTFTILPFQKPCNVSLPCTKVFVSFAKRHVCRDIFHRSSGMEELIILTIHSDMLFSHSSYSPSILDIEDYPVVASLWLHQALPETNLMPRGPYYHVQLYFGH